VEHALVCLMVLTVLLYRFGTNTFLSGLFENLLGLRLLSLIARVVTEKVFSVLS
jgi:hypothetical protein